MTEKIENFEVDFSRHIAEVKSLLRAKHQLVVPDSCEEFVKRCLRVKGFHTDKAVNLIVQYRSSIEIMKSMNLPLKPSLNMKFFGDCCQELKRRDHKGRPICIFKPAAWDPSLYSFEDVVALFWMTSQVANCDFLDYQRKGFVSIIDCTGVSWKHAWATKPMALLNTMTWIQNGVLCRMKGFHIIFNPKAVTVMYLMMKPLLKDKMKKRIHFHGNELSSLHKHFEPEVLPPYLRHIDEVETDENDKLFNYEWLHNIATKDDFFEEWLKVGFPSK